MKSEITFTDLYIVLHSPDQFIKDLEDLCDLYAGEGNYFFKYDRKNPDGSSNSSLTIDKMEE